VSVTTPAGFVAAAGAVGIKAGGAADFAVVATADGRPVSAAGVFTANLARAAPVQVSQEHLQATGGRAAAVVVTSGNANAATGSEGRAAAAGLCRAVAEGIGADSAAVLVCQTGLIGVPFPFDAVAGRIGAVVARRGADPQDGAAAARAILTTDTFPKEVVVEGPGFTIGAMAKGAAMLAPNLATMLAVLTTDAQVAPADLHRTLVQAVGPTFNALTVDGCTSTNDTVVMLASGLAGPADMGTFGRALEDACGQLAYLMASDAEGSTKVFRVRVTGAASDADAHRAARQVAGSLLVKCSLNGADPYWGRVVSELGSAGVAFDLDRVAVSYGGVTVCSGGVGVAHDETAVRAHMAGQDVEILCDLGLGPGVGAVLGTDLGHGYIDENRTTS